MAKATSEERLADYERRYREFAAQLAEIGLISSGSVRRPCTRCATPGCKRHGNPPRPHGPYYQWTAEVDGKTVTRRLSGREAQLYREADRQRPADARSHHPGASGGGEGWRAEYRSGRHYVGRRFSRKLS